MRLIGRIYSPDLAVLPIGGHFTMDPREARFACELLGVNASFRRTTGRSRSWLDRPRAEAADRRRGARHRPGRIPRPVRERWFGATGRRVPEIAVEGELDLATARSRRRGGRAAAARSARSRRPIVVRAASAEAVKGGARAPGGRVGARSARSPRAARRRPPRTDVWAVAASSRRIRSSRAISTRISGASPCNRSSSPSAPWFPGRARVGAIRNAVLREPALRPRRARPAARGALRRRGVELLTAADDGRAERQVGVVDAQGRSATFTGDACHDWAGGRTGNGYAAQGNILVSQETVDALAVTFEQNGHLSLAERLVECLAAAQARRRRTGEGSSRRRPDRGEGRRLCEPLGRRRRSARRRSRAPDRRIATAVRIAQQLFGINTARGLARRRRSPVLGATRPPRQARLRRRAGPRIHRLGRHGEPRGARRRVERIDPVVLGALRKRSS